MDCLARWMLDHHRSLIKRRESLGKMREKHGDALVDDLKARMMIEWKKRKAPNTMEQS